MQISGYYGMETKVAKIGIIDDKITGGGVFYLFATYRRQAFKVYNGYIFAFWSTALDLRDFGKVNLMLVAKG